MCWERGAISPKFYQRVICIEVVPVDPLIVRVWISLPFDQVLHLACYVLAGTNKDIRCESEKFCGSKGGFSGITRGSDETLTVN